MHWSSETFCGDMGECKCLLYLFGISCGDPPLAPKHNPLKGQQVRQSKHQLIQSTVCLRVCVLVRVAAAFSSCMLLCIRSSLFCIRDDNMHYKYQRNNKFQHVKKTVIFTVQFLQHILPLLCSPLSPCTPFPAVSASPADSLPL